jgi:hypothetical protein
MAERHTQRGTPWHLPENRGESVVREDMSVEIPFGVFEHPSPVEFFLLREPGWGGVPPDTDQPLVETTSSWSARTST